jgi:undecaprenyl-diphosphatase
MAAMDFSVVHALNAFLARHDGVEDPVVAYANAAEALFLALLAGLFVLSRGLKRHRARRAAIAGGLSATVALALAQVITHLVHRPRPFVKDPSAVHLFSPHAADPSFPSDHATASFAIAVAILLRSPRWGVVALAMATVLAVARVAMGIHYPTDVIGGAALGSATALALWAPAVRNRLHDLTDRAGALWDGLLATVRARVRVAGRS